MIRTLIVDDEPLARDGVRLLLQEDPGVEVVGEAADGRRAAAMIKDQRPDLVFLDVQMPVMDGFAALDAVAADWLPVVVFATAYDKYAIKAFEVHAIDYLLKPFTRERFRHALDRAREQLAARGSHESRRRLLELLAERIDAEGQTRRFVVKAGDGYRLVKASDITSVQAQGNYVKLTTASGSHMMRMTMADVEKRLDPKVFARIHRSTVVNIDCIRQITPAWRGDFEVLLADGQKLRMSRHFRDRLLP
jgi:two-component system, LytTR family, response regulator